MLFALPEFLQIVVVFISTFVCDKLILQTRCVGSSFDPRSVLVCSAWLKILLKMMLFISCCILILRQRRYVRFRCCANVVCVLSTAVSPFIIKHVYLGVTVFKLFFYIIHHNNDGLNIYIY